MNKVDKIIKLLQEGNQEVKDFLTALSVDPELSVNIYDNNITLNIPKDFDKNLSNKIDDILERNT